MKVSCETAKPVQFRHITYFDMSHCKMVNYEFKSFSYIDLILCDKVSAHMRDAASVRETKSGINVWKTEFYSCGLIIIYVQNIGYLQYKGMFYLIKIIVFILRSFNLYTYVSD